MGRVYQATCHDCGHQFRLEEGGGRHFEQLRCHLCGAVKTTGYSEIGEPFSRYSQGLKACVGIDSDEEAERIAGQLTAEYRRAVESMFDKCSCGGAFRLGAPARCPKCRSTELERGEVKLLYD